MVGLAGGHASWPKIFTQLFGHILPYLSIKSTFVFVFYFVDLGVRHVSLTSWSPQWTLFNYSGWVTALDLIGTIGE